MDVLGPSFDKRGAYSLALRKKARQTNAQEGQAVVEYILLLSVVVLFFVLITQGIARMGITPKLMASLTGPFANTYKYGHPKAQGFDEGAPKFHPRIFGGEENFRLFFNPDSK